MKRVHPILGKILKVLAWVILGFVLLLFLLAGLIQIPAIQDFLVHKATSFVSNKTKTRVEIERISVSLTGKLIISGLFLEDLEHDTLVYIGSAKINASYKALISNKISIENFTLNDVTLNIKRSPTDSSYNFNFLITAFSTPDNQEKVKDTAATQWKFSIGTVGLKRIRILYDDGYAGLVVYASLDNLSLEMDDMDIQQLMFNIDQLRIDKLQAEILLKDTGNEKEKEGGGTLPTLSANKIQINNSRLTYEDISNQQSILAAIQSLNVKGGSVNLPKEAASFDKVALSKSEIRYHDRANKLPKDTTLPVNLIEKNKSQWTVQAQAIDLADILLAYDIGNEPIKGHGFDPNHMEYKNLTLAAKAFNYSDEKTEVSIENFKAVDQHGFRITRFETDFRMDQSSVTANALNLIAGNSILDADLSFRFPSFDYIKDSFPWILLDMDIRKAKVSTSDILYFKEDLSKHHFFKDSNNQTDISGKISGRVNALSGEDLVIKSGIQTVINANFFITDIHDLKNAHFSLPGLSIVSGRRDIETFVGPAIPSSIQLPQHISLQIDFTGQVKAFDAILDVNSSYGLAHLALDIDKNENFEANLALSRFNLGSLLKDTSMFGQLSLTAEAYGQGLEKNSVKASIKSEISEIYLHAYTYHNLHIDGTITAQEFVGKVNLNDENAIFELDGLVNLNPGKERIKLQLNVEGADLQRLKITKEDIRIALTTHLDLSGNAVKNANGMIAVTKMSIAKDNKIYVLDSLLIVSVNNQSKGELNLSSALMYIRYSGSVSPFDLMSELRYFLNKYFPITDDAFVAGPILSSNFNFEIHLHNHPIFTQILFPKLIEFEPGIIQASFDSELNDLKINISVKKIIYGATEARNIIAKVDSDISSLNYHISSSTVSNKNIKLNNFLIAGNIANNIIYTSVSAIDDNQRKKFELHTQLKKEKDSYKIAIEPRDIHLAYNEWSISPDNYIEFGKDGFLIHNFQIHNAVSQIEIASVNDRFNDDVRIMIKNLVLDDISRILEKDTNLIKGIIDGDILLKRVNNTYGLIAAATASDLIFRDVPIGNLSLKADNPNGKRFDIEATLSSIENNIEAKGYFIPEEGNNFLNIEANIQSLSMKTIEALSMGQISEASGTLSGHLLVQGNTNAPEATGLIEFKEAFLNPAWINNRLELKHETIILKPDGIYLSGFTILDENQHTAVIDGSVKMKQFKDYIFDLQINTKDFLLLNTTAKDNKELFGRMVIDSKIDINGPISLPVINAVIRAKDGSSFTFVVPEEKLTTYKGEDVVEFLNTSTLGSILERDKKQDQIKNKFRAFDLSAIIEIEKTATLKLLMDPSSADSLVVRGEAALSFSIDRSGKISLTGAYNLQEGSYQVSLQSIIKKQFDIIPGSTIVWSGDLLDAEISINTRHSVRAAPYDLVAAQMSGMSDLEKGQYKQQYPFWVILKMRGNILHPIISFEIQLPPEDKGILGGAINQRLSMLNDDPSALNKQVFALLIMGRFTQENPLQTESNVTAAFVRTSVGKILSAQLNQLSSKVISGVEMNFDIQSYDDYQSGQAKGRTELEIGIKKQLFNDRVSIQLGPTVNIEGESASQNSTSEITSDVMIEYKLTKDNNFRLKGFRHNQYAGAIEGQLVETGIGLVYVRDFNEWRDIFRHTKSESDSTSSVRKP